MQAIKLFYSWQSDRPAAVCRDFIGIALEAAKEILATNGINLDIDSDTKGVAGTPPVTETILGKIRASDLFLADMTFVAETDEKRIPNPNVMAEYGYALHAKGSHRILLVMNTHYGPPDELPFDLRHLRHPDPYDVAPEAERGVRRAARETLGRNLAEYIAVAAPALAAERERTAAEERELLRTAWWSAVSARTHNDVPSLVFGPSALVHVVPYASLEGEGLDPREVKGLRRLLRLDDGGTDGAGGQQWWSRGPKTMIGDMPNGYAEWYGRLIQPGIVEYERNLGRRIENDPCAVLKGKRIEGLIVEAADQGLELVNGLGLAGPFAVGVVLQGLGEMAFDGGRRSTRFNGESLQLPVTRVPVGATQVGDHMRRALDQLWMSAGFDEGSPSYARPQWAGYRE
jgi:hypothetical protein